MEDLITTPLGRKGDVKDETSVGDSLLDNKVDNEHNYVDGVYRTWLNLDFHKYETSPRKVPDQLTQ